MKNKNSFSRNRVVSNIAIAMSVLAFFVPASMLYIEGCTEDMEREKLLYSMGLDQLDSIVLEIERTNSFRFVYLPTKDREKTLRILQMLKRSKEQKMTPQHLVVHYQVKFYFYVKKNNYFYMDLKVYPDDEKAYFRVSDVMTDYHQADHFIPFIKEELGMPDVHEHLR